MNASLPVTASCVALLVASTLPLAGHECPSGPDNELVTALLSRQGSAVALLPGALPEDLRNSLSLPAGARVVASAVQEDLTSVVAVVPLKGAEARRGVEAALTKTYWIAPTVEAIQEGGFVSSEWLRSLAFCGEKGEVLSGRLIPHPDGSLLTLHYERSAPGECRGADRSQRPRRALEKLLPRLEPPEGARMRGSGGGGGGFGDEIGDTVHRTAVVETDLLPAELAEHFASQLTDAGWQLDAVAAGSSSTLQLWLYKGEQGKVIGELSTTTLGPGKVAAKFMVTQAAATNGR